MTRGILLSMLVGIQVLAAQARGGVDGDGIELKVVVHINFSDSERQAHGLKNVSNILKAEPSTRVEVVCHGAGINLVEKHQTANAEAVEALGKQGVCFVACENTMRQKAIRKEGLLPGVDTVPSGAVEVIRKQQQDGYAYFKP